MNSIKPAAMILFAVSLQVILGIQEGAAQTTSPGGGGGVVVGNPPPGGTSPGGTTTGGTSTSTPRIIPLNLPDWIRKMVQFPKDNPEGIAPVPDRCVTVKSSSCRVHAGQCVLAHADFLCDEDIPEGAEVRLLHTFPGDPGSFEVTQSGFSLREFCESVGGTCVDFQEKSCPWGDLRPRTSPTLKVPQIR